MDELSVEKFLICNGHKSTRASGEKKKHVNPFSQRAEVVCALHARSVATVHRLNCIFCVREQRTKNVLAKLNERKCHKKIRTCETKRCSEQQV